MLKLDFSSDELNKKFANSMKEIPGGAIGVAVSGGGDSVALLALSSYWARTNGRIIEIAETTFTIELTGPSSELDGYLDSLDKAAIIG